MGNEKWEEKENLRWKVSVGLASVDSLEGFIWREQVLVQKEDVQDKTRPDKKKNCKYTKWYL